MFFSEPIFLSITTAHCNDPYKQTKTLLWRLSGKRDQVVGAGLLNNKSGKQRVTVHHFRLA